MFYMAVSRGAMSRLKQACAWALVAAACGGDDGGSAAGDPEAQGRGTTFTFPDRNVTTGGNTTGTTGGPPVPPPPVSTSSWDTATGTTGPGSASSIPEPWPPDTTTSTSDPSTTVVDSGPFFPPMLPPPEPFGDDAVEQELIGGWVLSSNAVAGDEIVLAFGSDGRFAWFELEACKAAQAWTGTAYVVETSLVLHVETALRPGVPWDTQALTAQSYGVPFRLRLSYTLHPGGLSLSGPSGLTRWRPYLGRAYVRDSSVGPRLGGTYVSYAQLDAFVPGTSSLETVVLEKTTATLEHADLAVAGGKGVVEIATQTYSPTTRTAYAYENADWTDDRTDPATQVAGGGQLGAGTGVLTYQFGPSYYATYQLSTNEDKATFRKGKASACPGVTPPPPP